jgi:putative endonuclease
MNNWSLYLLENTENKYTYLGVTVNINRRIRQHNGELVGGAKYTSSNKGKGEWILKTIVNDLTKSEALSFERIIKNKRRKGKGKTPLDRRNYLIDLVVLNKNIEHF